MAPQLASRAPQCVSCIRRVARLGDAIAMPAGQQVRGKKRLVKIPTVDVQLLRNVPGYGRKGAVVPVTRGIMRNLWFPNKMAEYVTLSKLHELKKENIVPERDPEFPSRRERKVVNAAQAAALAQEAALAEEVYPEEGSAEKVELPRILSPQEATDLISELLPPNIDFYRVPIPAEPAKPTEPEPVKRLSPSISAKSAIYAAAAAAEEQSQNAAAQAKAGIYGSVSTSDIAANLKAVLEESSQGSSIVLSHENISFVDQMEDRSRVKQLGLFDIEIKLSGAANAIRRTVTVNAQG